MAGDKIAVENSVLRKAKSLLFFIERLALLVRIFLPNHAWWSVFAFALANLITFIMASAADDLFEGEYLFWIERVAAIFMSLSYWATNCRAIALGLFVLSNVVFTINYFVRQILDVEILSRIGSSNTRESEGEELVKERAEIEDDPLGKKFELNKHAPRKDNNEGDEELLQTDNNCESRRNEEDDQEALETGKMKKIKQLILDVLLNLRLREIIFFLERPPIFLYLLTSRRFPWCFAIFLYYSSLLHLLSLISSRLNHVHPTPIRPEYLFRIERTAMALSGLYFIHGSHVSCWYLALGLFALSNAVHFINLIAPQAAGRVVQKIIFSLYSTTCSPNSREISKGEELVKEQAKMEDEPPMSKTDQEAPEKENDVEDEDDSDCSEMDNQEDQEAAEKRLQIATLLISFEQILAPIVLIYVKGSLPAWRSAIFFCLNILCVHYIPIEPYFLFIDRVSMALLSVFYLTGSIFHGGLATGLFILSDVICIMNEIRKEQGKEVQKNIDICSKTCSLNPIPSDECEDHDPQQGVQEAAQDEENDFWDFLDGIPQQGDQEAAEDEENDFEDHDPQQGDQGAAEDEENDFEDHDPQQGDQEAAEEEEENDFWDFLDKIWMKILNIKEIFHNNDMKTAIIENERDEELEETDEDSSGSEGSDELQIPTPVNETRERYEEEDFWDFLDKIWMEILKIKERLDNNDKGVLHNYERHCRTWEEERNVYASKLHAATESSESYRARLRDSERVCHVLRGQNVELAAKLNVVMATNSSAERFHKRVQELEDKCWVLEKQKNDLTATLSAATARSQLYRSLLHNA